MTAPELAPLVQVTDPYETLTYNDIYPRINFAEVVCVDTYDDVDRGRIPCKIQDHREASKISCQYATCGIFGAIPLLVGGVAAMPAFPVFKCVLFGLGGAIVTKSASCSLYNFYRYRKFDRETGERFDVALQEADGDLSARVSDVAIVDCFSTLPFNLYRKLDFNHTVAIYAQEDLRDLFWNNMRHLNGSLIDFWEQVRTIHAYSEQHFRESWPKRHFQEELSKIPRLRDVVIEYLPENLKLIIDETERQEDLSQSQEIQPLASTSQPASSSRIDISPRVKFILDGTTYVFDSDILIKTSSFFKEKFDGIDFTPTQQLGAEPQFVNLQLDREQENYLGNLLHVIRSKKVPLLPDELSPIYTAALVYGLEPLLRSTYLQVVKPEELLTLLLLVDDLEWLSLKAELMVKIIRCLNQTNTLEYDYVTDPYHFRSLYNYFRSLNNYARETSQTELQDAICENFITAFKEQLEKNYKIFKFARGANTAALFERYAALEILKSFLSDLEYHSLRQELQIQVNLDVEKPVKLQALIAGFLTVRSPSMLHEAVKTFLKAPGAKDIVYRAYTIGNPMPEELYILFNPQKN